MCLSGDPIPHSWCHLVFTTTLYITFIILISFMSFWIVESRTNKMSLVRSSSHKVYKTKWSHWYQPRWLPINRVTSVQEGNYWSHTRHIWQGHIPKIHLHMIITARSAEWDHPQIGSWGNSPLAIRGEDTEQRTQKGRVHHSQGITEAGSRLLLSQPSSTHLGAALCHTDLPWHWPLEVLPC